MRSLPTPLACAIGLATLLALLPLPHPSPPAGTRPDDRIEDRVVATVGAPVIHTAHGFGAPLEGGVWLWTETAVAPGQRVAATGKLRTPRGFLDPGVPDRAAALAARGCAWELAA